MTGNVPDPSTGAMHPVDGGAMMRDAALDLLRRPFETLVPLAGTSLLLAAVALLYDRGIRAVEPIYRIVYGFGFAALFACLGAPFTWGGSLCLAAGFLPAIVAAASHDRARSPYTRLAELALGPAICALGFGPIQFLASRPGA